MIIRNIDIFLFNDIFLIKKRNVLMLVKYHGLKNKEVAEILGISVKTVDNHLAAAIRDVLEALQKQDIDSGSRMRLMSWLL